MMTQVNFDSIGGGGGSQVYEEDLTLSRSADTTINCGFEPRIILLFETASSSYPTFYGYNKDGGINGDASKNAWLITASSGSFGALGTGSFNDNSRGSIKSVSSTGCVINPVSSTSYNVNRHIIIYGA